MMGLSKPKVSECYVEGLGIGAGPGERLSAGCGLGEDGDDVSKEVGYRRIECWSGHGRGSRANGVEKTNEMRSRA